jgi:hypothetical protein
LTTGGTDPTDRRIGTAPKAVQQIGEIFVIACPISTAMRRTMRTYAPANIAQAISRPSALTKHRYSSRMISRKRDTGGLTVFGLESAASSKVRRMARRSGSAISTLPRSKWLRGSRLSFVAGRNGRGELFRILATSLGSNSNSCGIASRSGAGRYFRQVLHCFHADGIEAHSPSLRSALALICPTSNILLLT